MEMTDDQIKAFIAKLTYVEGAKFEVMSWYVTPDFSSFRLVLTVPIKCVYTQIAKPFQCSREIRPFMRNEASLLTLAHSMVREQALHEANEHFRCDGILVVDPHAGDPELASPTYLMTR